MATKWASYVEADEAKPSSVDWGKYKEAPSSQEERSFAKPLARAAISSAGGLFGDISSMPSRLVNYFERKFGGETKDYDTKRDERRSAEIERYRPVFEKAQSTVNDPNASIMDKSAAYNTLAKLSELGSFAEIPQSSDVARLVDLATNSTWQPSGTMEDIGSVLTHGATQGAILGLPGGPFVSGIGALAGAGAAAGQHIAGELGLGEEAQFLAGLFGGYAGAKTPSAAKAASRGIKAGRESIKSAGEKASTAKEYVKGFVEDQDVRTSEVQDAIAKSSAEYESLNRYLKVLPENEPLPKAVLDLAKERGVDLPPSAVVNNPVIRLVEDVAAVSDKTGKISKYREKVAKQIDRVLRGELDEVSKAPASSSEEVAQRVQSSVREGYEKARQKKNELYNELDKTIPKEDILEHPISVSRMARKLVNELESPVQSSEQSTAYTKLKDLLESMYEDVEVKAPTKKNLEATKIKRARKDIPVKDLLKIQRAIRDIASYEYKGSAKNLLKLVDKKIDDVLKSYGSKYNPKYLRARNAADEFYKSEIVEKYGAGKTSSNPQIQRVLRSEDPKAIVSLMDSPIAIRRIEKALGDSKQSKKQFAELKKAKLLDLMGDDPTSSSIKKLVTSRRKSALMQELVGKDGVKRLKTIVDLMEYVESHPLTSVPKKAAGRWDAISSLGWITSPAKKAGAKLFWNILPELSAEAILDKNFIQKAEKAAVEANKLSKRRGKKGGAVKVDSKPFEKAVDEAYKEFLGIAGVAQIGEETTQEKTEKEKAYESSIKTNPYERIYKENLSNKK